MLLVAGIQQAQAQATMICQFDFNGNLIDDLGNGTINSFENLTVNYSGSELNWIADSVSSASAGGGLQLTIPDAVLNDMNYSIRIDFRLGKTSGYRKIIDFQEREVDAGLYVNDQLRVYSGGNYGDSTLSANTDYSILFTRSTADDTARVYIISGNSFIEQSKTADLMMDFMPKLVGSDRVLNFFHDDTSTFSEFSPTGTVALIQVWNGIVTPGQVFGTEEQPSITLQVYPNPASDFAMVQFPEPVSGTLEVFDVQGRLVSSAILQEQLNYSLNMQEWKRGIYTVRLGHTTTRLIKQ